MSNISNHPAVATTESGGPPISPLVTEKAKAFLYEVVQGFFIQNGPEAKHLAFHDEVLERSFGLIDSSADRWRNLKKDVKKLQDDAPDGVQYKVLFLDPELTPLGIEQAEAIHHTWKREAQFGAPIQKNEIRWFLSPFTRTAQTMLHSWGDLLTGVPEAWEDFREVYGVHTCDKRSNKSVYAKRFPMLTIERDFTEEDQLWTADHREEDDSMQQRARRAMDKLFGPDGAKETYISITGHADIFRNLLAVLGHQAYPLATGEMIPVVVKACRHQ
ncbi:hypothetical protein P7C73_g4838, partial [Tremellales sp. Uapishka_1]